MKLEKLYSIIEKKFHSFALTEQITIIFAASLIKICAYEYVYYDVES